MKITACTAVPHGVVILTDTDFRLRLEAWRADVIRLTAVKGDFVESVTGIVTAAPQDVAFTVEETDAVLTFSAGRAAIRIRKATFALSFLRDGEEVSRLSGFGMQLIGTTVTVPRYLSDRDTLDKVKLVSTEERPGCKFYLSLDLADDERIYGLGQFNMGTMDRRQSPVYLYQTNDHAPVPFFVSSRGYGMLVDTGSYAAFARDSLGTTFYADAVDNGEVYFVAGRSGDEAVAGYRYLTGQAPLMPKWLFGYVQSKERYSTQQELLDVVDEYRRRKVPLDMIVQDWSYWPENTWSEAAFDPSRYPDPTALCRDLHDRHAHVIISVWPNTRGGDNFKELFDKDQLLTDGGAYGGGGIYNAYDPAARDTYWRQLNDGIFRHGFDGWWCDASEPFEIHYGQFFQPEETAVDAMHTYKKWIDSRQVNLFSLRHSQGIYEHQRQITADKRVVNLTRSGYAGQQRYSTVVWSGDIGGSFEVMRQQVAEGVNYSAAGLPYWSIDIGGFWSRKGGSRFDTNVPYASNTDPGYRELYTRWVQFGCFLPVFRSHGTCFAREIWRFGEEGDIFYDSIRKFIELRYTLLPYIYSTAWQVTRNGASFLRPLGFAFAGDETALRQSDSYLFGEAFLVSPVTEGQYYEGADTPLDAPKQKDVYLPAGTDWYDFFSEKRLAGGQTVTVETPIDAMPLFVRAGSLIPTAPVMQYVDEIPDAPYTLTVYPGADGAFTLYEDEGDGYAYESGAYAETDLRWDDAARRLTFAARRGDFPGMTAARTWRLRLIGGEEKAVTYTGDELTVAW
ncbi:MAG: TIM-barrel domain-containing protein [Acutalibacteraceae bacterium]|jgi:alpha-D-xyloside xylohydrolase